MKYNFDEHDLKYTFNYHLEEKENISKSINKEEISIEDIRRVALWKYNRIIEIEGNLLERLSKVVSDKNIDIESKEVKNLIEEMVNCKGIGMPLASTILKFLRPDVFPIVDTRAYRAIFGKKVGSRCTYDKYIEYCKEIYKIRDIKGIKLSEVDEQLYMFDKDKNGKI